MAKQAIFLMVNIVDTFKNNYRKCITYDKMYSVS